VSFWSRIFGVKGRSGSGRKRVESKQPPAAANSQAPSLPPGVGPAVATNPYGKLAKIHMIADVERASEILLSDYAKACDSAIRENYPVAVENAIKACAFLASSRDPRAVDILFRALANDNRLHFDLRWAIVNALAEIGDCRSINPLASFLKKAASHDPNYYHHENLYRDPLDKLRYKCSEPTIHEAAKHGDLEKVKTLIENDPTLVVSKDKFGNSPLYWAAKENRRDVAQLLLSKGADANEKDLLLFVVLEGHEQVLELLVAHKADVNAKVGEDTSTLLHIAAKHGHWHTVKVLLASGADVNATNEGGWTPLHEAVSHERRDVVKLLLDNKADVNAQPIGGGSAPLHVAVTRGRSDIAELLLAAKANVNIRDGNDKTPVGRGEEEVNSARYGQEDDFYPSGTRRTEDVVKLLRQHGGHK